VLEELRQSRLVIRLGRSNVKSPAVSSDQIAAPIAFLGIHILRQLIESVQSHDVFL
jgi:hypothetical protein